MAGALRADEGAEGADVAITSSKLSRRAESEGLALPLEIEMLVKWKTSRWRDAHIERVECTRETDKAVWVLKYPWTLDGKNTKPPVERRCMKESDSDQFHDTWEAAHAFLLERAEQHLESCRDELRRAQGVHGNVKGMRKPPEPHEVPLQEAQG